MELIEVLELRVERRRRRVLQLVHHDEAVFDQITKDKQQEMLAESIALTHELNANGQYLSASPLQPAATAVIVRVCEGKPIVTDGPFIETREQIAGYFLIDAKDIDEAVSIAMRVPGARIGPVEVRPLREVSGLPGE